jgi:hypothetical protein
VFQKNREPLIVVVKGNRYECLGPTTSRSRFLFNLLQQQGGVAESVPDGIYHFNAKWRNFKYEITFLTAE